MRPSKKDMTKLEEWLDQKGGRDETDIIQSLTGPFILMWNGKIGEYVPLPVPDFENEPVESENVG